MTEAAPLPCPGCGTAMSAHVLSTHMGGSVTVDMCPACHAFWFDTYESLQLTPASTLRLFRLIGDEAVSERRPLPLSSRCPRCAGPLKQVEDLQRNTRFRYRRCVRGHGRFITFFDFLREKNFVKVLSAPQLAELRAQVQSVNCSNCGAPVDLQQSSACTHCGTPLSFFDVAHAQTLIEQLRRDANPSPLNLQTLPLDLLMARQAAEKAFADSDRARWIDDATTVGTVAAGVKAFARWLRDQAS